MIIMIDPPAFHAQVPSESATTPSTNTSIKMSETFRDLPPTFVHSMKKLFDFFDPEQRGRIPLTTISSRWNPDRARAENLPPDLITHLEKVTDRRGFLTFERFCAGLKIAILRHQPTSSNKDSKVTSFSSSTDSTLNRTSSLPNLLNDDQDSSSGSSCGANSSIESPMTPYVPPPPPKPPRYIYKSASRDSVLVLSTPLSHQSLDYSESNPPYVDISTVPTSAKSLRVMPPSYRLSHRFRRQNSRTRRHSVHALLESDVMGMVKKWEQERSMLEEGLRLLDRVRNEFQERLHKINQRLQNPYKTEDSEAEDQSIYYPKRLSNLNKALSHLSSPPTDEEKSHEDLLRQIERLKDQNRLLTEEVSSKSSIISSMEREKSAVIKELFQARSLVSQLSKKTSGTIAEDSIMTFI